MNVYSDEIYESENDLPDGWLTLYDSQVRLLLLKYCIVSILTPSCIRCVQCVRSTSRSRRTWCFHVMALILNGSLETFVFGTFLKINLKLLSI